MKEEAIDRTLYGSRFGIDYGRVVGPIKKWDLCTSQCAFVAFLGAVAVLGRKLYLEHWYELA